MEKVSLSEGTELRIADNGKIELIFDCENEKVKLDDFHEKLYGKFIEAIKLFSNKGLKLGNYNYDVDRHVNQEGKVEVYLTRYFEECQGCPLFDKECDGESLPIFDENYQNYPCSKMLPISPYNESGYDFMEGIEEVNDYTEFTAVERMALEMIWEFPDVLKRLYIPNND
jgi:hypothetical protein